MNNQYSLEDVLNLYEKHIYPINQVKKFRYESQKERFISYVENICMEKDLSFTLNLGSIQFGADVYSIIEDYYSNQALFLRGELSVVSFQEALDIIGNGISMTSYITRMKKTYQEVSEVNKKRRENWINFTQNIPVKFFYKNKFYFSKTEVENFEEGIVSSKLFHSIIVKDFKRNVSQDRLRRFLNEKYSNDVIRYLGAEYFYQKSIIEEVAEQFPFNDHNYLNVQEVSGILGVRDRFLIKCVKESDFFPKSVKQGYYYQFHVKDVEKWKRFSDEHRDLFDYVAGLIKRKRVRVIKPYSDDFGVIQFVNFLLEMNDELEIKFINGVDTPFPNVKRFINQIQYSKIEQLFEEHWHAKELYKEEGKLGRFKTLASKINNSKAPVTMNEFYQFAVNRISSVKGVTAKMMLALYKALSQTEKELMEHSDSEVKRLLEVVKQTSTNKVSIQDFCMFLKLIQNKFETKFTNKYKFNKHEVIDSNKDISAYSEEQYFRFGFLLINDSHEWYESFLERALSRRVYASLWLYGLLHYVCAWRRVDMIKKLPTPTLPTTANDFLKLVREKKVTEQMAIKIVDEVEMKVRYLRLKPSKTEKKNPPDLVLEIPNSIKCRLGMVLGICEAHRQIANGGSLIVHDIKIKENQFKFFGNDFLDIFQGEGFNNTRANRTFEILMAHRADEEKIGTGYIIASLSRSHKCRLDKKTNTTSIYLNNYRNLTDGDKLIRELFERGVCSFVPFLILKTVEGIEKVEKMSPSEQTRKMNELVPLHSYDAEIFIKLSDEVLEKGKKEALSLLKEYGFNENSSEKEKELSKKSIYRFINRIACGTAPAKENNMNCISVAKGNGCIFPHRKTCIGCGQELYLKSSFFIIGQKMRELIQKEQSSQTESEKYKYKMLVEKLFKPILMEMVMVLQEIYGVKDVTEYRKMVFGIANTFAEVK